MHSQILPRPFLHIAEKYHRAKLKRNVHGKPCSRWSLRFLPALQFPTSELKSGLLPGTNNHIIPRPPLSARNNLEAESAHVSQPIPLHRPSFGMLRVKSQAAMEGSPCSFSFPLTRSCICAAERSGKVNFPES